MAILAGRTRPSLCCLQSLLLACAFASSAAADVGAERTLSAADLVARVIAGNPSLQASTARVTALQAEIERAGALDDPIVSYAIAPRTVGSRIGDRHIVQASQALPWPGKRQLRAELAGSAADEAAADVETRRRTLVAQARRAWAQWWYVERALEVNADDGRLLSDLIPVAQMQYAAGIGGQQDVLQVRTRSLDNQRQRIALQQQLRRVLALIEALQGEVDTGAAGSDAAMARPGPLPRLCVLPEAGALAAAMFTRYPELERYTSSRRGADTALELARLEFLPDLRFLGSYVGTLDPDEKRLQLGIGINLPLQRGRRRAAVDAAEAMRLQLAAEQRDLMARLQGELQQRLADAREMEQVAQLYDQQLLALADQNLDAARADYRNGRGDFANVIAASQQRLQFQLASARARADLLIARAELSRLTGTGWAQGEQP